MLAPDDVLGNSLDLLESGLEIEGKTVDDGCPKTFLVRQLVQRALPIGYQVREPAMWEIFATISVVASLRVFVQEETAFSSRTASPCTVKVASSFDLSY